MLAFWLRAALCKTGDPLYWSFMMDNVEPEDRPLLNGLSTLTMNLGNSFMPYHDYGRGGRGWRDLWQDQLALLLMDPGAVHDQLFANFAGVRLDGSNATIIGDAPGESVQIAPRA